jgi:hypothetical protein
MLVHIYLDVIFLARPPPPFPLLALGRAHPVSPIRDYGPVWEGSGSSKTGSNHGSFKGAASLPEPMSSTNRLAKKLFTERQREAARGGRGCTWCLRTGMGAEPVREQVFEAPALRS